MVAEAVTEKNKGMALEYLIPKKEISASAPCRVDFGGTLDLPLFYHSLGPDLACTFNMALNLRTSVKIRPYKKGRVCVVSKGFAFAEFPCGKAPYKHPLGLVFAILDAFGARDIFVEIHSASPPRSALGGSSVMAVALVALLMRIKGEDAEVKARDVVLLAKSIESAVAGVPCGMQDQLAAAFGGIHLWHWDGSDLIQPWKQSSLMAGKEYVNLSSCMLVAYGGEPHDSLDVNGRWVQGFAEGKTRMEWEDIALLTRRFSEALSEMDLETAISCMKEELAIRLGMTPDVLDPAGMRLASAAGNLGCGVRFAGAGGGGCVWALGSEDKIDVLRNHWQRLMDTMPGAFILNAAPEMDGVLFDV